MLPRNAWFALFWFESIFIFWGPLRQWVVVAARGEYNHIVLIPGIAICLIYWKRRSIFGGTSERPGALAPLLVLLACPILAPHLPSTNQDGTLALATVALIAMWASGFALSYGLPALRAAQFPFLFLLLMVPAPSALMDRIVQTLQTGTADLTYAFFRLGGVPMFREGFRFELPGLGIEVLKECSSIHSSWALFILGTLLGGTLLRTLPARVFLVASTVPLAMFTNSVRIVTLWFLATHVDMSFMSGKLHHSGGILFSQISLAALLLLVWILRKLESRVRKPHIISRLPQRAAAPRRPLPGLDPS